MGSKKNKGMAIIAVLTLLVILVMLTTSLVLLTREHLFQAGSYYDKITAQNLAEAGLTESIMVIKQSYDWGADPADYLLMESREQTTGLGISLPSPNSLLSYDVKGLYYITFDPNAEVPYSTNNLQGDTVLTGWQGRQVPPGKADIIVNVAVGNVLKHLEGMVTIPFGGKIYPVCGGKATFRCKTLTMRSVNDDPPLFHSNSTGVSIGLYGPSDGPLFFDVTKDGKISTRGTIKNPPPPAYCSEKSGKRTVPEIKISDLPGDGFVDELPGGTYSVSWNQENGGFSALKYQPEGVGTPSYYFSGGKVATGVEFDVSKDIDENGKAHYYNPRLSISSNVRVSGNGNLTLKGLGLDFVQDGDFSPYLYLGGDYDKEPNEIIRSNGGNLIMNGADVSELNDAGDPVGPPCTYQAGNITGAGCIYSLGNVQVGPEPNSMDGGYIGKIDCGKDGKISLYAEKNVTLTGLFDPCDPAPTRWAGLIYSKGNFNASTRDSGVTPHGTFNISNGSLIVKGNVNIDTGTDGGAGENKISIEMNTEVLEGEPSKIQLKTDFWQYF